MVNRFDPQVPSQREPQPGESKYEIKWPETAMALKLGAQVYAAYARRQGAPRRMLAVQLGENRVLLAYSESLRVPIVIRGEFVPSRVAISAAFSALPQADNPAGKMGKLDAVVIGFTVPSDTEPCSQTITTCCDPESDGAKLDFPELMDLLGKQGREEILMALGTLANVFNNSPENISTDEQTAEPA